MSNLTTFRDHCRRMAEASQSTTASGSPTPSERALWQMLADEIDDYLGADDEQAGLLG